MSYITYIKQLIVFTIKFLYKNIFSNIKISKVPSSTLYQKNKERLQKSSWKASISFWGRVKQKLKNGCKRYKNYPEDEQQKRDEFRKNIL